MGIQVPTNVPVGSAGSLIGSPVVNAVPLLGAVVLAPGDYCLYAVGANVTVQVYDGAAWQNISVAGAVVPFVTADGINVRLSNAAGVQQLATTQKIG